MKARLILADAATAHPDGTFSVLRAGITHIWGEAPPYAIQGALVVRIEAEMVDKGPHRFDIRCMNQDGAEAMPSIQGTFEVPQGGGVNNFVLSFSGAFLKPGTYLYSIRVDEVEQDRWTVHVVHGKPPGQPS